MNDPYVPPIPRSLILRLLLSLLLPLPSVTASEAQQRAQPATTIVQHQFDATADSLRNELVIVAEEQIAVVAALRTLRCDTSAL